MYEIINGEVVFLVSGKSYNKSDGSVEDVTFGLLASDLKTYGALHRFAEIAQFYTLVQDGLILTRHVFEGLNRKLFCDNSPNGDQEKLIYTRKPTKDYEWVSASGKMIKREAPKNHVFVVIISPNNRHKNEYPNISGWVNSWVWVEEDQGLAEAPINWVDRYSHKLWTRE